MATRHLARSIILQSLFEWDFRNLQISELAEVLERNIKEFGPGIDEGSIAFIKELANLVVKNN